MDYAELSRVYEKIESTSKRLEKTHHISELLKKTPANEIPTILLLIRGRIYPDWDKSKLGVASKLVIKAINVASGMSISEIENRWREIGDLGLVAEEFIGKKSQVTLFSEDLSVEKVFSNLRKLSSMEGSGSTDRKIKLISELLSSAKGVEARYIVRTALEDLRVGIGDGTIRDSVVWAFMPIDIKYDPEKIAINVNREEYIKISGIVQSAYDKANDFGVVALAAKEGIPALEKIDLVPGNPVKVMLAQKVTTIKDGFKKVGVPADIEYKYDGFRMQIHKFDNKIKIYTRRLEEVTNQFPEVKAYVENNIQGNNFIIDCEAVGYDAKLGKYMVFQHISQRIRRKYNIHELAKKLPVELNIFDILYHNGKTLLNETFENRRKLLESIVKEEKFKIILSKRLITSNEEETMNFFNESLAMGNEGIMLKSMDSPYKPGSRVGFMVKFKPVMDTLDLVVVGAEWGEGKRSGWLTSFTLACVDDDGNFLEIGKVGTGVKEKPEEGLSFGELTDLLKPHIIQEKGREVKIKPEIVLEIQFEEIQKSTNYSSNFALRFPRVKTLRDDRAPEECSNIEQIKDAFYDQTKQ